MGTQAMFIIILVATASFAASQGQDGRFNGRISNLREMQFPRTLNGLQLAAASSAVGSGELQEILTDVDFQVRLPDGSTRKLTNGMDVINGFVRENEFILDDTPRRPIIPILSEIREDPINGVYSFAYETADGLYRQESGFPQGPSGAVVKEGYWSFVYPDGTPAKFSFVADENGYHVESDLIPPMPPHAIAQIEKAEREKAAGIFHDGQYREEDHFAGMFIEDRPIRFGSLERDDALALSQLINDPTSSDQRLQNGFTFFKPAHDMKTFHRSTHDAMKTMKQPLSVIFREDFPHSEEKRKIGSLSEGVSSILNNLEHQEREQPRVDSSSFTRTQSSRNFDNFNGGSSGSGSGNVLASILMNGQTPSNGQESNSGLGGSLLTLPINGQTPVNGRKSNSGIGSSLLTLPINGQTRVNGRESGSGLDNSLVSVAMNGKTQSPANGRTIAETIALNNVQGTENGRESSNINGKLNEMRYNSQIGRNGLTTIDNDHKYSYNYGNGMKIRNGSKNDYTHMAKITSVHRNTHNNGQAKVNGKLSGMIKNMLMNKLKNAIDNENRMNLGTMNGKMHPNGTPESTFMSLMNKRLMNTDPVRNNNNGNINGLMIRKELMSAMNAIKNGQEKQ